MTTQDETVVTTLESIVRRFAPAKPDLRLEPNTHLVNEAGIDSPRMIDIVLEIEDRFGFVVDDELIQKVRTFGDLVTMVNRLTPGEAD